MRIDATNDVLFSTGSTSGSNSTSQDVSAVASKASQVGETQFLQLLIAQLQNQDPLNPVDNQDFIAQLATFSSLEELTSINSGIAQLVNIANGTAGSGSDTNINDTSTS